MSGPLSGRESRDGLPSRGEEMDRRPRQDGTVDPPALACRPVTTGTGLRSAPAASVTGDAMSTRQTRPRRQGHQRRTLAPSLMIGGALLLLAIVGFLLMGPRLMSG